MDSLITAAALALAHGDPLGALKRVALRDDAPALALRGIAMAQLGDFPRARTLLQRARRAFGPREVVARARCTVAEAEIALVSRDLTWPIKPLDDARAALEARGDHANAAYARVLAARRMILTGRLAEAARLLDERTVSIALPPIAEAAEALARAGLAIRRIDIRGARAALNVADAAARRAGIPALKAEVDAVGALLGAPVARLVEGNGGPLVSLPEVEALLEAPALIVDACRHAVRSGASHVRLDTRPVLFSLLVGLARAWPGDIARAALIREAFRGREADESHRARLRVEIGRLREVLLPLAEITATADGYRLLPAGDKPVVMLAPPFDAPHAAVLALLSDGEAWSSTSLAIALGSSTRTVQRALDALAKSGTIQSVGRGPARRWMAPPVPGFPTSLLLPGPTPGH
ncbi:helix-turn-helix domain-containing protein [Mesorhizobium sp. BR1-1-16]|uniref:helix-turn-helix domain-containing protein n=1 Tax=Mesorhizobium sp. BR1-1-16 TaxID=2876653 RepID=UPI001CC9F7BB|nr:helix-turn-helix domain-containing protein [Mesorhizobium sp. BR1-1-16]MBZ9936144.1 helix-turn-helix domain-containing protein [Mesorhizobium sp. BR1-1-16]